MVAVWDSAPVAPELPDHLPGRARVVVIGGGVIGTSIAYHLAHLGWGSDVVLLERDRMTSGTTWHAAGLMTCFGSFSETSTSMRLYSRELYARLEAETGQATGFKPVGLIEAAADADRLEEYRRVAAFQRHLGLEVDEISPAEMNALFPWAKTDDLLAGTGTPVYLQCLPRSLMHAWVRHHAADEGKAAYVELPEIGTPDEELTTIVDTSALLDRRQAAIALHRSQQSPFDGLPDDVQRTWLGREHLVRANPPWDGGPQETELLGL